MSAKKSLARRSLMACLATCLMACFMTCLFVPAQGYDPLGSEIFLLPGEQRVIGGQDSVKRIIDPYADPLGIEPLMRPIDPQHSAEYLDVISGRDHAGPFAIIALNLRGNWRMSMYGSMPGTIDLLLAQNKDAVFGRGILTSAGTTKELSASGWTVKDVLYLDLVDLQNMMLFRCTLTMSESSLSGSFNAYDAMGGSWSGPMQGSRLT
ncbi:MAG TPA: hypothetical protein PLY52_00205 [Methanothrix sp.]|jgi:hypothetical protein|uniref:hypothetical protein n=1 Tax=Methanothrix sp. TaxID=90426 RepID=UPI002D0EAD3F|nr:hypothetical protein [Methanothrix sp.]MDI9416355.1 hypothetical protein [Euryarchaeota archaeon]HON34716.1 hypothetical protein [Methanothrix sp.]HRU76203.1 hypothetical protein [Methanothrix sp.]